MMDNFALIIDDSRAIRMTLARFLQTLGFASKEFEDAETAVTWLREGNSAMLAWRRCLPATR